MAIVNYLIFLYCEDYFLAKGIQSSVDLNLLKNVANLTTVGWDVKPIKDTSVYAEGFTLSNWNCIPNLLSEHFEVR